jgi:hypothetical protein
LGEPILPPPTAILLLKNGKVPGMLGMRVEDLKARAEEYMWNGDQQPFCILMEIIVAAFESGELPQACNIAVLVLIPKPASNEHHGIRLLEVIWKLISSIVNGRMWDAICFDDAIHGFHAQLGAGTAIIQQKLHMKLDIADKSSAKHNLD